MQFTKVAFGRHGNWFVAGDQLGHVYHFDIAINKFKLVMKAGHACTGLACCITRPTEILVALADYTVKCVDIDSGCTVAVLRGHEACVHSISLHSCGRFALAVSSRDSVLWDLNTFTRSRTLNGGEEVGVQDVFFVPLCDTIVSCFKDDSIHAWDSTNLEYRYQIPPPFGPTPHYRAFAVPQDGRFLVGGGRSNFLHVWTMETKQLLRIIQLPAKIRHVKQIIFVPSSFDGGASETLGFLAQDGIVRFLNIHSCKQLFQVGSQHLALTSVHASPVGKHLVGISESGDILLYDITIGIDLRQPPRPDIKVMESSETMPHVASLNTQRPPPPAASSVPRICSSSVTEKPVVTKLIPKKTAVKGSDVGGAKRLEAHARGSTSQLNRQKLLSILKGYGEYPAKYRVFIWRSLLELPENHSAYSSLLEKGTHPAYLSLHQHYPIKSRKLLRVLQRALSALAQWTPLFGETQYLPGLVFPFVKMFQNNQLITFEILATVLINWCGQWFEYFPNPPLNVLAMVENCLAHHDPHLLQHFIKFDITSQLYAWPMMETLFSEVLLKGEWLRVWDNLVSQHPGYMLLVVVAYLTIARHTLFKCNQKEDFEYFFRHQNTVDIGKVILEANLMQQTTPSELHPEHLLEPFVPLTQGTYPVFNKYPKYIVDYQIQERQRIRLEELEYLRERQSALEVERMMEQRRQEEEAWYRQQQQLLEAEQQRHKIMEQEERKLTDQRTRLQALKRELKVKELHTLDAARRRFLEQQQVSRETELKRMDANIQKKVLHRERETKAVLQDIETRTIELEKQKALLEIELQRCQQEMCQRLRAEGNSELQSRELEKSTLERAVEEDVEREQQHLDQAHARLAKTQAQHAKKAALQEAKALQALREMKHDVQMEELAEKARLNQLQRRNVQVVVDELQEETEAMLKLNAELSNVTSNSTTLGTTMGSTPPPHPPPPGGTLGGGTPGRGGSVKRRVVMGKQTTAANMSAPSPPLVMDDSNSESALLWSSRRTLLDQQESAMLSRIRELREKVASQMNITAARSYDSHTNNNNNN